VQERRIPDHDADVVRRQPDRGARAAGAAIEVQVAERDTVRGVDVDVRGRARRLDGQAADDDARRSGDVHARDRGARVAGECEVGLRAAASGDRDRAVGARRKLDHVAGQRDGERRRELGGGRDSNRGRAGDHGGEEGNSEGNSKYARNEPGIHDARS
jgi:hypothetical protein